MLDGSSFTFLARPFHADPLPRKRAASARPGGPPLDVRRGQAVAFRPYGLWSSGGEASTWTVSPRRCTKPAAYSIAFMQWEGLLTPAAPEAALPDGASEAHVAFSIETGRRTSATRARDFLRLINKLLNSVKIPPAAAGESCAAAEGATVSSCGHRARLNPAPLTALPQRAPTRHRSSPARARGLPP